MTTKQRIDEFNASERCVVELADGGLVQREGEYEPYVFRGRDTAALIARAMGGTVHRLQIEVRDDD